MQRALRKSRTPRLWTPASVLLAVVRKLLQIVAGLDLHAGVEFGAGLMILHGSRNSRREGVKIGVDCILGQVCTIGGGSTPGFAKIGDHVYISPHTCILGPVTIGDGAMIAASSLVLTDVPAGHTAIGVPARICRASKANRPAEPIPRRQATPRVRRRSSPAAGRALRRMIVRRGVTVGRSSPDALFDGVCERAPRDGLERTTS